MNQDKAREFFSAFYEGNLEPGLQQSLDLRLRNDPSLRADYSAFVATMEDLSRLGAEEIEAPAYLSDRIATRVEQEIAKRRTSTPTLTNWLRGIGLAGLGAAAILGAVLSFHSSGATSAANFAATGESQPSFRLAGSAVAFVFHPSGPRTVVVSSAVSGREIQRFTADPGSASHSFENRLPGTALFQIQVLGDSSTYLLALPGSPGSGATGLTYASPGSIKDFAVALAGRYRLPVVLEAADTSKRLTWKLDGVDPNRAAATAVAGEPYVVDQREDGILYISDR